MAASIEHELKAFEYTPDGDLLEQSLDSSFLSHMRSKLLDDFVSILNRYISGICVQMWCIPVACVSRFLLVGPFRLWF